MQKRQKSSSASYLRYSTSDAFPIAFYIDSPETERQKRLFPRHYHDQLEIGHCHSGEGIFAVGNRLLRYRSGDTIVIPPGVPHHMRSRLGTASVWSWMFFEPQRLLAGHRAESGLIEQPSLWTPSTVHMLSEKSNPGATACVRRVIEEVRGRSTWHQDAIRACLRLVLIDIRRLRQGSSDVDALCGDAALVSRIRPALEYIRDHYHDTISNTQLARACSMAGTSFRQRFRLCMGTTPHQYVLAYRVSMASLALLHRHDMNLGAIAREHGFLTLSSFLRAFKRQTGLSPRRWAHKEQASAQK